MAAQATSKSIKTGSLLLDSKNTRIPAERRTDDQRQLLHLLLEHEDVKELTASIAKHGLFPNERLVVLNADSQYIVLEGNRRLASIKLLLNPELAPTSYLVTYFRNLSEKADLSQLSELDCAVVTSRTDAAPIIAAIHTRESKKPWSPLQQARFYRELIDEGETPEKIAEDVGLSLGQVNGFLRAEKLHSLALGLGLPQDVHQKIADSKYPLTSLARFLESRHGRKFLGIELDDGAGFRGVVHPDRFKAVLARVAVDSMEPGITRRVNNEEGFIKYINETNLKIPKTKIRGKFTLDELSGKSPTPDIQVESALPKQVRRQPKVSRSIVPTGYTCLSKHDRVRAIFHELRHMKIEQQRNSTGVMLRVLIDVALWSFFKDNNHVSAVLDHYDPNGNKRKYNPDWTPPLRDLISYAVEKKLFLGMPADGYKSVRTLASKDVQYMITIEGFNSFTHNPTVTPTEGDLRALWQRASAMLDIILN